MKVNRGLKEFIKNDPQWKSLYKQARKIDVKCSRLTLESASELLRFQVFSIKMLLQDIFFEFLKTMPNFVIKFCLYCVRCANDIDEAKDRYNGK